MGWRVLKSSLPHRVEETVKHPPPPYEVEEIANLLREIQQKFNNFAEKFVSPSPYGEEEPANQPPPPYGVEEPANQLPPPYEVEENA